jgi:hypothetical protein
MKWHMIVVYAAAAIRIASGAPVPEQAPSAEAMAKLIPNYEQWEPMLLKAAQVCGLPPKTEWLRDRLDWYWREAMMHPLEIDWKSFAGNLLHARQQRQDVDFKNQAEKKAKVKLLKANGWEYAEAIPATNQGINQCWVKHRATKTDVTRSATSVAIETRTMTYEVDQWFQYVWDEKRNNWSAFTPEQKEQVQVEAEREYEKKVRARIVELRSAGAQGPRKNYVDSTKNAAVAYNKLTQQAATEPDPKKKEQLEYRLPFEWKSAFGSLLEAYQDSIRAAAMEVHLKGFRSIPWN